MINAGEWCLKNKQTAIFLFVLAFVLGIISFLTIPRLAMPEFDIPVATIVTPFPGASPSRVEQLVTDKLEITLRDIPQIEWIDSHSVSGASIIQVHVYDKYKGRSLREVWEKVRNKVSDARSTLPKEALSPIINDEFGDVYGILIALTGRGYSYDDLKKEADNVRQRLYQLPHVAKISLFGEQDDRIYVEFSNARLSQFGFTPFALADILQNQNTIASSGNATLDNDQIILETTGEFDSLEALRKTEIQIPGHPESVHLGDLTTITRGYVDPPDPIARFDGENAIIIGVSVQKNGNMIEMGENIVELISELTPQFPSGMNLSLLAYQPTIIEKNIKDFMRSLFEAISFVIIVMLFFAGLRSGIITGMLIPISLLTCIIFLPIFHVQLEQISIGAMIIALGILVDNGVVVCEYMLVLLNSGVDRLAAVKQSVKRLWSPLLSASICTVLAFLPIPLAKTAAGDITYSLFIVLSLSLMFSWIFAMTFIPFLCYYFLKPKIEHQTYSSSFYNSYRKVLLWSLKNRTVFIGIMAILLCLTIWGFRFIPKTFFPPNEEPIFMVELWTPQGTDIRKTSTIAADVEAYLLKQPEVKSVGSFIGDGGPRWQLTVAPGQKSSAYGVIIVNTDTDESVDTLFKRTNEFMENQFPDLRYLLKKIPYSPTAGAPIQIQISGDDISQLYAARDMVENLMKQTKGLINIRDDWGEWSKKLIINVQQRGAKQAGLTSNDIALSLQTQISGYEATQFRHGDETIPIVIRSDKKSRNDIGDIEGLNIYSLHDNRNVPLSEVAKMNLVWQPSSINRRNQVREITLNAEVQGRTVFDAGDELHQKINALTKEKKWPAGFVVHYRGEIEKSKESQDAIFAGIPLSAALLIFVLIAQFNSLRNVIIILLTIPLIMIGITPGLLLTHAQFGFMAMLGLISLCGIVVNHAILMLDQMNIELKMGYNLEDSILLSAQRRLRPILITALTTSVGLIPLSFEGGEMWRPMSNTIIFGVLFSTVLTLILCPVLYSCFYGANFRKYIWRPELVEDQKITPNDELAP